MLNVTVCASVFGSMRAAVSVKTNTSAVFDEQRTTSAGRTVFIQTCTRLSAGISNASPFLFVPTHSRRFSSLHFGTTVSAVVDAGAGAFAAPAVAAAASGDAIAPFDVSIDIV